MAEGASAGIVMYIHFHRVIPYICCFRYNNGRQLTNIRLLFLPLQVDWDARKDYINSTSSSGNDLASEGVYEALEYERSASCLLSFKSLRYQYLKTQ